MKVHRAALILAISLGAAAVAEAGPTGPVYEFDHGVWWDGATFVARTVYTDANGLLREESPPRVDEVIDLHGGYVIPPLAEGHNHWLEPAAADQYNACYLADGVYYVRDMGNVPYLMDQMRDKLNLPTSVDLVSAMTPFTGPGAHPVEIIDQFVQFGILPKEWKPDYDRKAEFVVRTEKDIDERFPELLRQNPRYVKAFLLFSEEYEQRLNDPSKYGNHRGMDPKLLPHLVKLAHAAGLKVAVHVYSAPDFRNAIAAGADNIEHIPGDGASNEPQMGFDHFKLTLADAKLAAAHHVTVTSTLDWLANNQTPETQRLTKEVMVPNLIALKNQGVAIMVGSDHFRRSSLGEVLELRDLKVFSNQELLDIATRRTTNFIFPERKLGKLAEGFEANFLVLERDPAQSLDNLKSIVMRVKQGHRLTLPESALKRASLDCVD
jgi:hypothetical protein